MKGIADCARESTRLRIAEDTESGIMNEALGNSEP